VRKLNQSLKYTNDLRISGDVVGNFFENFAPLQCSNMTVTISVVVHQYTSRSVPANKSCLEQKHVPPAMHRHIKTIAITTSVIKKILKFTAAHNLKH